jgi:hypothetical protein
LPIFRGRKLRTASDSDVKWLGVKQLSKIDRGLRTYIDLHENQIPQQALRSGNCLCCYPPQTKIWFVEIFEESGSKLRSISVGPASKKESIQQDHIWYLKHSANTSVVAVMSGFADGYG